MDRPRKRRKIAKRERLAVSYDIQALQAKFSHNGVNVVIDLNGMPSLTIAELALRGAFQIVRSKKDPKAAAEHIRQGNLSGRPTKPPKRNYVIASSLFQIPLDQAAVKWKELSNEQRRALRHTAMWKKAAAVNAPQDWERVKQILGED
ncbi:MAG: hypothetical protein MN733_18060 [Nitrososphaera sp.]|nr:hypothetical protein [Nitrososphaera sp.]